MPCNVEWLVERRVAYLNIQGDVAPDEAQLAYVNLMKLIGQGETPVHLILEHGGKQKFPLSMSLYNFIINGGAPLGKGCLIVVGSSRQARFVGNLFSYVSGVDTATFTTLDAAADYLYKRDPSLVG
jgi:hypothetical protein